MYWHAYNLILNSVVILLSKCHMPCDRLWHSPHIAFWLLLHAFSSLTLMSALSTSEPSPSTYPQVISVWLSIPWVWFCLWCQRHCSKPLNWTWAKKRGHSQGINCFKNNIESEIGPMQSESGKVSSSTYPSIYLSWLFKCLACSGPSGAWQAF